MNNEKTRETWLDWMRVSACFLVMIVHSTEPFYLGGEGSLILTKVDAFWASFFDSFARACVPIFIVASSYLQFPLHYSAGEFCRRRAKRILVPFIFWTLVYALVWGDPVSNFKDLLLNFNYAAGHLWFVYMLIGLYVIMPLLSPWAEKVEKRELQVYLFLCLLTTFIPFVREAAIGDNVVAVFGSGGIPMPAKFPLWGEASWNDFSIFYYLSGFVGYLLLGLYLRKFAGEWSRRKCLAIALPSYLAGFSICFFGFFARVMASCGGTFPVEGTTILAAGWETPWCYGSIGVVLMTIGWVLVFKQCSCSGAFYRKVILPVSKASYGMYLCHMLALASYSGLWRGIFGIGGESVLGIWTAPVEIVLTAVCSFVTVALFSVLVRRIPKVGSWIIS